MEQRSIRVEAVGSELEPVVVVENFAPDPEGLIAEAGTLQFQAEGGFYPGVRVPVGPRYFEGIGSVLGAVMQRVFGYSERARFTRALYALITTPPAELNLGQRIPHFDAVEEGRIAIVHYLSRAEQGGTAFYRHRTTGFETVDASRHQAYLAALQADFAAHGEPAPGYIQGDTPIFEQTARFGAVFNRALIYRSKLLHCADLPEEIEFSGEARTGRLTVTSFLTAS